MKILNFIILIILCHSTSYGKCPQQTSKKFMLGKVAEPSKFYTPIRNYCGDETLNIFSNCIEKKKSKDKVFFGNREKLDESPKIELCPHGYATQVVKGELSFQEFNGKKVCLNPCNSVAVGKFFRDQEKFGERKALSIGDVVYIPELKGEMCGEQKHDGCAIVSQFIEYTSDPVIDFYSGTCKKIKKGLCLDFEDKKFPQSVSLFKLKPDQAKSYAQAKKFPGLETAEKERLPAEQLNSNSL